MMHPSWTTIAPTGTSPLASAAWASAMAARRNRSSREAVESESMGLVYERASGLRWPQNGKLEAMPDEKAQPLVDAHGACIVLQRGEEGRSSAGMDVARDLRYECLCAASATEVGVCADCADLGEAGGGQPLACHGGESAIDANSKKTAYLCGVSTE